MKLTVLLIFVVLSVSGETYKFLNKSDVDRFVQSRKGRRFKRVKRSAVVTPWKITAVVAFTKEAKSLLGKCRQMGIICQRRKKHGKFFIFAELLDNKLGKEFYQYANRKFPGSTEIKKLRSVETTVYLVRERSGKKTSRAKNSSRAHKEAGETAPSSGTGVIIIGKRSAPEPVSIVEDVEEQDKNFSASAGIDFGSTKNGVGYSAIKLRASRVGDLGKMFDYKMGVFVDHIEESVPISDTAVFWDETFLRLRRSKSSFTFGFQKINWGRVVANSAVDRFSRLNYRRAIVDEPEDQNLPAMAVRAEFFRGNWKLDTVVKPFFKSPLIPNGKSVWSLYEKKEGTLLGERDNPGLAALIFYGSFEREFVGSGGYGVRLEHFGSSIDVGVAFQSIPWNEPYYQVNPKAVLLLEEGVPVEAITRQLEGKTFQLDFPQTNLASLDFGANIGSVGARIELGLADALPVRQKDFRAARSSALLASSSFEFFPFSGSAKVNVAISTRKLSPKVEISDELSVTQFLLAYEDTYKNDFWKLRLNLGANLDADDMFFNAQLRYLGFDVTQAFVQYRHFSGVKGSIGGHYSKNSGVAIGLQFLH